MKCLLQNHHYQDRERGIYILWCIRKVDMKTWDSSLRIPISTKAYPAFKVLDFVPLSPPLMSVFLATPPLVPTGSLQTPPKWSFYLSCQFPSLASSLSSLIFQHTNRIIPSLCFANHPTALHCPHVQTLGTL